MVLGSLPQQANACMLVGPETMDDAGIFKINNDLALVQTLDFFPPIADDPYWFGAIAAANSISDVYAMGGEPLTAMSILCWPKEMSTDILRDMMRGAAEKIMEAGAVLIGGHSVSDKEIKFGLSVTGKVHPDQVTTNSLGKAGQTLILTKPLGMGAFSTALKKGFVAKDVELAGYKQMAALNKSARDVMLRFGIRCATDITGFGLMGHARNIAQGSGLTVEIESNKVPVFESSREYVKNGLASGASKRNAQYLGEHAEVTPSVDPIIRDVCFDAETSGGILMAVEPGKAGDAVKALLELGVCDATVVGRLAPKSSRQVRLL